ncbi:hypothetical protein ACFQ3N_20180 [Virgibacillus byunsanensis]|uniref:Uncharacterized protein n=1 Tax=Virgibacillus byunsanensis TaxID=570945 RepID=A0ABW3LT32_9BACI
MKFVTSYQFSNQEVMDLIHAIDITTESSEDISEEKINRLENIKNTFLAHSKHTESELDLKKNS